MPTEHDGTRRLHPIYVRRDTASGRGPPGRVEARAMPTLAPTPLPRLTVRRRALAIRFPVASHRAGRPVPEAAAALVLGRRCRRRAVS